MFPCTALGKPLLKIGTMLTKAVLFHFMQLGCVPIFMPYGDFSLFRLQRVKTLPADYFALEAGEMHRHLVECVAVSF